jgi:hypothetical protein
MIAIACCCWRMAKPKGTAAFAAVDLDPCNGNDGRSPAVPLGLADQRMRVHADRSANLHELRNIQPPLTDLDLGDERLPLTDSFAQLRLGHASGFARLDKPREDALIEVGSKGCHVAAPVDNQRSIETRI